MFISDVLVLTMIVHLCIPLTFSQGAKISVKFLLVWPSLVAQWYRIYLQYRRLRFNP